MNGYKLWEKKPNTIFEGGKVFTKTFYFETNNEYKNRLVRVYLPSTYDFDNPNKRYKTIYMLDGKNLFDDYTSFVGEWKIDESIEEMIDKKENDGYIVIGIDAPNKDIDRSLEMSPDILDFKKEYDLGTKGYASLLGKFIFEVVKPDIDKTFYTLREKEYTGVGGSSMGGIMSFYLGMEYPDKIKYCLNFSPAFFLFTWESIEKYIKGKIQLDLPKQYFYVGGEGFERKFVDSTIRVFDLFLSYGWTKENMKVLYDSEKEHNEKAWSLYFPLLLKGIDQ